jgi:transposase
MSEIPQELEAYPVHHLPIIKAYADQLGLVEVVNQLVPTEMDIDSGTSVLGMILDTWSGRSPLYRLAAFLAQRDTELLLGQAVPAEGFNDDPVGRVLDRLYEAGTTKLFTACAVRADQVFGFDKRYVHVDTTSVRVYGDSLPPEESLAHAAPFTITHGYSKDKRPDLKPFIVATLCVDRAVPLGGPPEDGNAADKTLKTTIWAEVASLLAQHGVPPGASISVADAAFHRGQSGGAGRDVLCQPAACDLSRMRAGDRGGRGARHLGRGRGAGAHQAHQAPPRRFG